MAKLFGFVLARCLLIFPLIQHIVGQAAIAPRLNAAAFEDGRSIWTLARYTNYSAYASINPKTPADYQLMRSYTQPDVAIGYDADRNQLFQLTDLPVLFSDENSIFLSLPGQNFAHLYVPLQSSQLNVQIYSKTGSPIGPLKKLFDVLQFSAAVSESDPAKILIAYFVVNTQSKSGSAMYSVLDSSGNIESNSTLIASNVFAVTTDNSYQPSIAVSSTADGNFIINWNAGTGNNNNNQLIRAAYLQPGQPITQAFIVAMSNTTGFLRITKCGTLRAGDGHFCIYDDWSSGTAQVRSYSTYITQFSFTGATYDNPAQIGATTSVDVTKSFVTPIPLPLPYGGMVVVAAPPQTATQSLSTYLSLYNREFVSQNVNQMNIAYGPLAVLPSTNTVLSLFRADPNVPAAWPLSNSGYQIISQNVTKFLPDSGYGNPTINNTLPQLGSTVNLNTDSLTIYFYQENYRYGVGNITIYALEGSKPYLREIIPVIPSSNQLGSSITVKVSPFAFNTPGTQYQITIDGGTFRSSSNEPLMGLQGDNWNVWTAMATNQFADKDDVTLQLRLQPSPQPRNHDTTSTNLATDLSNLLPVEANRISCRYLRADHGGEIYQVTLKKAHTSNGKIPVSSLVTYLNQMLAKKDTSPLNSGSTTRDIDAQYGAKIEENMFASNRNIFIAGGVVIVLLAVLYTVCHRRFPESNNMILFVLAVSLFNFIAYLMFVIFNSSDVPYLRIPSIIFLLLPFAFYMLSSTMIIVKEVTENPAFHEWFSRRTMITAMISLLASINPVLLNILQSRFAGFNDLNAPFSENVSKRILYCTATGLVLSDLPHLIIQSLFKSSNGYFTLFPFLSMVSSILGILFSIIGHIYNHLAIKKMPRKNSKKKGWEELRDGGAFEMSDTHPQIRIK
ncbi:hypothetical protein K493DRAFT_314667 [Basidiobolus meristosporus CBS 931.73]|uniref:G-protein coupled receptors family 3 profile domain-containing protein n=1 Tax=Basidiobolus meristosporus CBS 931.73 TaxID=1314790 RepID=A0A1Y1YEG3_9FUNG|nr:hypothetical protein K493DRAFT_314667 [Basidiobolus meristosporus CBS 931.73]|eukprot:ORX96086.1 hypothetical protein K493DRAFT_314667 [Basidiobolus meristosporus CBS 931.73]